ncbi:MAG: FliO/MopB family protein [Candidatus Schekmanbacteria bacterium]|nr:FliO/MopB family protein [Candidatus Schekmanbacteria bacterium]
MSGRWRLLLAAVMSLALALWGALAGAGAQQTGGGAGSPKIQDMVGQGVPDLWDVAGRGLVALLFVLGLILVAAAVARRLNLGGAAGAAARRDLHVAARRLLGDRRELLIVEARGKSFLLGSTQHGITLVSELPLSESMVGSDGSGAVPPPVTGSGDATGAEPAASAAAGFRSSLRRAISGLGAVARQEKGE